jgi:hypothetical protein
MRIGLPLDHPANEGLGVLGKRGVRTNRTPDEWHNWCLARERISKELSDEYYRACTTGELPPQLVELQKGSTKNSSKVRAIAPLPDRRFPPPWSVEDIGAAFVGLGLNWRGAWRLPNA